MRDYLPLFALAFLLVAVVTYDLYSSPRSAWTTIRHRLAAPNCAAARSIGLAPARRGMPGYYERHDADLDGLACEPFRRF